MEVLSKSFWSLTFRVLRCGLLPSGGSKSAFTLAEVLITLGIIGVVSAMTIPNIISNYQRHKIETMLKEDYSIFAQVNRLAIADGIGIDLNIPDNRQGVVAWFETYLQPYLKVSRICEEGTSGCWSPYRQTRQLNGMNYTDCKKGLGCGSGIISFILNNGTMVTVDGGNNQQLVNIFGIDTTEPTGVKIYVDVNGDNPPDKFGVDIFLMAFTEDGLVPAGYSKTFDELKTNCSTSNNGNWCMAHVKNSGWKIPDEVWAKRNK